MASDPTPATFGRHGLGPHVVGQRVVVRQVLPGESGPTGGPAFTDVLGVCERWSDGEAVVRRADGDVVTIPTRLIVSGKPIPPRPSRLGRFSRGQIDEHLDRPGQPVWLGALAQLSRTYGPDDDTEMTLDDDVLTCVRGQLVGRGVHRDGWIVVDRLDDPLLLGNLIEWGAELGADTIAVTDPRVVEQEIDLLGR